MLFEVLEKKEGLPINLQLRDVIGDKSIEKRGIPVPIALDAVIHELPSVPPETLYRIRLKAVPGLEDPPDSSAQRLTAWRSLLHSEGLTNIVESDIVNWNTNKELSQPYKKEDRDTGKLEFTIETSALFDFFQKGEESWLSDARSFLSDYEKAQSTTK